MGDEEDEVSWIGILNSRIRDQYVNWIQKYFKKVDFHLNLGFQYMTFKNNISLYLLLIL